MPTSILDLTTLTVGIIAQGTLTTADTVVYTVPVGKTLQISTWTIHSRTTVPLTVQAWVVPSGGAQSNSNKILNGVSLPARDVFRLNEFDGAFFDAGTKIVMTGEAGPDFINFFITGKLLG